uniref:Uncharacterized protein n=1 Tax=Branchiostoma floridae TaxID=7739 RepID=C3ZW78_BRAFL|eukprot:XP_002587198.1 hypothetical protein BRAFLDRAFT_102084 [Branchiostoma floridae]
MACLQACTGRDDATCRRLCPTAYFLAVKKCNENRTVCHSPSGLKGLPLSNVSTYLTGCGPHRLTTKADNVPTDATDENQMQNSDTSFIDNNNINKSESKLSAEESYQDDKSTMINFTQAMTKSANNTTTKKQEDDKVPVLLISIFVIGTFLTFIFIICIVGMKMKNKLCREEANIGAVSHGHPVVNHIAGPVNHGDLDLSVITPPIVNSKCHGTTDDEDLHYYHSSDTDEIQTSAPSLNVSHQSTCDGDLHYYHSSDTDEIQTSAPSLNMSHQSTTDGDLHYYHSSDTDEIQTSAPSINASHQSTCDGDLHYYHSSDTDEIQTSAPTLNASHQSTSDGDLHYYHSSDTDEIQTSDPTINTSHQSTCDGDLHYYHSSDTDEIQTSAPSINVSHQSTTDGDLHYYHSSDTDENQTSDPTLNSSYQSTSDGDTYHSSDTNGNQTSDPTMYTSHQNTSDEDLHYYRSSDIDENQTSVPTLNVSDQSTSEESFHADHLPVQENTPHCMGSSNSSTSQLKTVPSRLYASLDGDTSEEGLHNENHYIDSSSMHNEAQAPTASPHLYALPDANSTTIYSSAAEGLDHGHPVALDNEEQFIEPIYGTHAQAAAATASRLYNMCD